MKANFHISLRIIRGLLHIQMSVNMLYSKADTLSIFVYMLIMLLASISFLGLHLTPVTIFGQLLRWFNAISILRNIELIINHGFFFSGLVVVFGKYFNFFIGSCLGRYEDQQTQKKRSWDIWSFFLGAKKTEFKIKMEAVKEEILVPFEIILKVRSCSK